MNFYKWKNEIAKNCETGVGPLRVLCALCAFFTVCRVLGKKLWGSRAALTHFAHEEPEVQRREVLCPKLVAMARLTPRCYLQIIVYSLREGSEHETLDEWCSEAENRVVGSQVQKVPSTKEEGAWVAQGPRNRRLCAVLLYRQTLRTKVSRREIHSVKPRAQCPRANSLGRELWLFPGSLHCGPCVVGKGIRLMKLQPRWIITTFPSLLSSDQAEKRLSWKLLLLEAELGNFLPSPCLVSLPRCWAWLCPLLSGRVSVLPRA